MKSVIYGLSFLAVFTLADAVRWCIRAPNWWGFEGGVETDRVWSRIAVFLLCVILIDRIYSRR